MQGFVTEKNTVFYSRDSSVNYDRVYEDGNKSKRSGNDVKQFNTKDVKFKAATKLMVMAR